MRHDGLSHNALKSTVGAAAKLSVRSVTPSNVGVRILYGALPTVVVTSAGELEPSPHLRGR